MTSRCGTTSCCPPWTLESPLPSWNWPRLTGRDKTRIIGNLDALEQAGLLSRRPDPMDRRAKIVEISDAGKEVVARCRKAIARMEDEVLADIPDGDRRTFLNVLGKLTNDVADPKAD